MTHFLDQFSVERLFSGKTAFELCDTHGMPLQLTIDYLLEKKKLINFAEFILTACKAGWSNKKIYNTIYYAINEIRGHEIYKNELIEKLNLILKK